MSKLPGARVGSSVLVKKAPLRFSYWPMYKGTRRYGLQSHIYVTNPWSIMDEAIRDRCPSVSRNEARAALQQAKYFYAAGTAAEPWAAKPLLFYYFILNAAKAYILTEGIRSTLDKAQHGLSAQRRSSSTAISDAYLDSFPSQGRNGTINIFSNFLEAVAGFGISTAVKCDLTSLLPQLVAGHRLWCGAAGRRERFVHVHDVQVMTNDAERTVWLEFQILAADLTRLDVTRKTLLEEAGIKTHFREVASEALHEGKRVLRFEQVKPWAYTGRPSDVIPLLVDVYRRDLWATVLTVPPFRKYYLHLTPPAETPQRLPQLASIYAVMYFLGSVTRYRPQDFSALMEDKFGAQLEEILSSQATQFLYLIASEFVRREVTHPAIV